MGSESSNHPLSSADEIFDADPESLIRGVEQLESQPGFSEITRDEMWSLAQNIIKAKTLRQRIRSRGNIYGHLEAASALTTGNFSPSDNVASEYYEKLVGDPRTQPDVRLVARSRLAKGKKVVFPGPLVAVEPAEVAGGLLKKAKRGMVGQRLQHESAIGIVDKYIKQIAEQVVANLRPRMTGISVVRQGYFCAVLLDEKGKELPRCQDGNLPVYSMGASSTQLRAMVWIQSEPVDPASGSKFSFRAGGGRVEVPFYVGVDSNTLSAVRAARKLVYRPGRRSEQIHFHFEGLRVAEAGPRVGSLFVQIYQENRLLQTNKLKITFSNQTNA